MTTPEENAPKSSDTDQVVMRPDADPDQRLAEEPPPEPDERTEMGAEMEQAMEEAGVDRTDFGEE